MELQYRMLGADGQEYGPATLAEIQSWINQGRIGSQTQLWRTDQAAWRSASEFEELIWSQPNVPPAAYAPAVPTVDAELDKRAKSGAGWFFWIAVMSAVNSISLLSGADWSFIIGLGITQIFDVFGREMGGAGMAIASVLDIVVIGIFVMFGVYARKHHAWAFITGMVLYALDSAISLLAQDWLSLGFHGFAIYCIFSGYKASREMKQAQK